MLRQNSTQISCIPARCKYIQRETCSGRARTRKHCMGSRIHDEQDKRDVLDTAITTACEEVIHKCNRCKRFQVKPLPSSSVGNLPKDRTSGQVLFQAIDYAGPIKYRHKKLEKKAYILLYS